jgi:hypothetical protein
MDNVKPDIVFARERLEKLRKKLREKLMHEELECVLRFEAVDRLMRDLNVDPENFAVLWVQPLLAAGASLDVALVSIAKSQFQPN